MTRKIYTNFVLYACAGALIFLGCSVASLLGSPSFEKSLTFGSSGWSSRKLLQHERSLSQVFDATLGIADAPAGFHLPLIEEFIAKSNEMNKSPPPPPSSPPPPSPPPPPPHPARYEMCQGIPHKRYIFAESLGEIKFALKNAQPGDLIEVKSGIYFQGSGAGKSSIIPPDLSVDERGNATANRIDPREKSLKSKIMSNVNAEGDKVEDLMDLYYELEMYGYGRIEEDVPVPAPAPEPAPQPAPKPAPQPAPKPAPQPAPKPAPQPAPKPAPQPAPKPAPQPAPKPAPQPAPKPAPKPSPISDQTPAKGPAPEPAKDEIPSKPIIEEEEEAPVPEMDYEDRYEDEDVPDPEAPVQDPTSPKPPPSPRPDGPSKGPWVAPSGFIDNLHGTVEEPITLCGPKTAVFDGSNGDSGLSSAAMRVIRSSHVRVKGFTLQNALKGLDVQQTNSSEFSNITTRYTLQEGIRLRYNSTYNEVTGCNISYTGFLWVGIGEGMYVGTSTKNSIARNLPEDRSDFNKIAYNHFWEGITAENIDLKEFTSGGIVANNTFNGSAIAGLNGAIAWVAIKGNNYTVVNNTGSGTLPGGQGFRVLLKHEGLAEENVVLNNTCSNFKPGSYCVFIDPRAKRTLVNCDNKRSDEALSSPEKMTMAFESSSRVCNCNIDTVCLTRSSENRTVFLKSARGPTSSEYVRQFFSNGFPVSDAPMDEPDEFRPSWD